MMFDLLLGLHFSPYFPNIMCNDHLPNKKILKISFKGLGFHHLYY